MKIIPLRKDLNKYIRARRLENKWKKARSFFERDIRHPSLETELLEPHWRRIYSFRIDKKYRVLFFIRTGEAEVFKITNHYKK
jgi:plasmid maintenance system killer protein